MYAARWLRGGILTIVFLSLCALSQAAYKDKMKKAPEPAAAAAEAPQADAPAGMPSEEEMMAKMQEYATPNENHQALSSFVGEWDFEMKWWKTPESEPQISQGTSESQWILGGRFVEQTVNGTAMGQPFEGKGITGYDNVKNEYVTLWLDTLGTGIMKGAAQYDAATKTFTEKGDFSCPIAKGPMTYRNEIKVIDENSHMMEMYMVGPDGKEMKSMELVYTRKQ